MLVRFSNPARIKLLVYTRRNRRSNSLGRDRIFSCIIPFPRRKSSSFIAREGITSSGLKERKEKRGGSTGSRLNLCKGTPINSYRYSVEGERGSLSHDSTPFPSSRYPFAQIDDSTKQRTFP